MYYYIQYIQNYILYIYYIYIYYIYIYILYTLSMDTIHYTTVHYIHYTSHNHIDKQLNAKPMVA